MRSPVDVHLAVVQPVAPFTQRGGRQMQCGGVLPHAHPAPVHRLDVHRPERLERAIAHVRAHAETKAGAPLPALFLSLALLLTTQFRLIFRMFASRFLAGEVLQPTIERCRRQTVLAAIVRQTRPALTPSLDVKSATRIGAPCSRIHRSSSTLRRSPTCGAIALLNLGAETGCLRIDHGRQDKSTAIPPAQMVGWLEGFWHPAQTAGRRFSRFS